MSDDAEYWNSFQVRTGRDGKRGIYLRKYNQRLATFNAGTATFQARLAELFDTGLLTPAIKKATGKTVPIFKAASAKRRKFKAPRS